MVNFYDNYQQSKVMNYIPETAKELLKAQKEQVEIESKYQSILNDMAEKSNNQFVSKEDSIEYADIVGKYMSRADAIMRDPSMAAEPSVKFRELAKIHQEMITDRRLNTLIASNKNMAKEVDKIKPSLQGYFNRSILPYLKTSDNGTVWSENFAFDPEGDFKNISDQMQSLISKTVIARHKDGSVDYGVTQDRINSWVENNYQTLMSTMPGAVYATADKIERETISKNTGSSLARINFSDPIHSNEVENEFKATLRDMFSQYARSATTGGKKSNFNINVNLPRPTDPVAPIDILYYELDLGGLFNRAGSAFGAAAGKNGIKYDLNDLANKIKANSKGRLVSDRVTVSDPGHADRAWKSGAQLGIIAASGTEQNTVELGDLGAFRSTASSTEKNYSIFPALSSNTHAVAYNNKLASGALRDMSSVNKNISTGYNQNNFGDAIRDLSESKLVTLAETTSVSSDYILLPNGEVGSIARVKIPIVGNDYVTDPLKHLFGEAGVKAKAALISSDVATSSKPFPISIGNGMTIMIERVDYDKDKSPDGKKGIYFTFELAKPIGRMSGRSLSSMRENLAQEGKGINTQMGTQANVPSWGGKQ